MARADAVRARIAAVSDDPDSVTLVAVTKAFPDQVAGRALAAGLVDLGENYAQELAAKAQWVDAARGGHNPDDGSQSPVGSESWPRPRWHFVGGLQRNKVKVLAPHVALWHSVDRIELVREIAKRAPGSQMLVQVNTTGEDQKSGCRPSEAPALVEVAGDAGLDVVGLMTVGPTGGNDPRRSFATLRDLAARLSLRELSMGMSADLEIAVEEGATMVRVGTALFGPRPQR